MLTTIEMRWFYPGTIPTEVKGWFQQDCPGEQLGSVEAREDVYLYLPECDYLGIKLRQGKLEIKWRKAKLGILHIGEGWKGQAEKWAKWACEDPMQETFVPADVVNKGPWVNVKKVRSQRSYQSCHVEITQLNLKGDVWWSLGLEALTEHVTPIDNFQVVASQVLKAYPNLQLQASDSYAYPSWLFLVVG